MTVAELIEYLKTLPQDYIVTVPGVKTAWDHVDEDFITVEDEREMVHL